MTCKHRLPSFPVLTLISIVSTIGYGQPKAPLGPAPGRLVDIGGHKLHIYCVGPANTRPTVIFEAGGGGLSKDWAAVQSLLSSRVRTCAYDRAASGWSEPGPVPRTMRQEVFELHALLESAKVPSPFVLVGQSIGGLLVRLYTEQYGSEVAGLVLVDPTDESSMVFNLRANRWISLREQATGRAIPEPRGAGPPSKEYKPEDDYMAEECQLLYLHRKNNPEPLGDRPLFVLAAGRRPPPPGMTDDTYKDLRRTRDQEVMDLAHLSRNSKFVRDPDSGHNLHIDNPQLVVRAIEEVIGAVTNHSKLIP